MLALFHPRSASRLLFTMLLFGGLVFLPHGSVNAVGESLAVTAGTMVTFGVETEIASPRYSWVLTRSGQVEVTQADRFFTHVFPSTGVFDLTLTIRSESVEEETYAFIVESEPQISIGPTEGTTLRAVLRSEPPATSAGSGPSATSAGSGPSAAAGRVTLPSDGGSLILFADESTGNITEYRIDTNAGNDADGNGITDDDADNRMDPSFTNGGGFPVNMLPAPGEAEREIALRVIGQDGSTSDARLTVVFSQNAVLTPSLTTFPPASGRSIALPPEGGIVRFSASQSGGGVTKYALDLDLAHDTDGDGNSANDADAAGTAFERSGNEIAFFLRPFGSNRRRIALTVFGSAGTSATEERMIVFGTGEGMPPVPATNETRIAADVASPIVGSTFALRIDNPPANARTYAWDLQSDGITDTETTQPVLRLNPDAPGVLPVRVTISNDDKQTLTVLNAEFTVSNGTSPIVTSTGATSQNLRIDVTVQDLAASFQPTTSAGSGPSVGDTGTLFPVWDFGDGTKSYLLVPQHTYSAEGTYVVRLTLIDPRSGIEVQTSEESVTVHGVPPPPSTESGKWFFASILRSFAFILRVALFTLLLLFLLALAALAFAWLLARREGKKLTDVLRGYTRKLSGAVEEIPPQKSVTEIIEAASVPVAVSEEPAPVRLAAEEEMQEEEGAKGDEGAQEKEIKETKESETIEGGEMEPEVSVLGERGALPPWLQEGYGEEVTEEIKEDNPPSSRLRGAGEYKEDKVPPWLAEGLKKVEATEESNGTEEINGTKETKESEETEEPKEFKNEADTPHPTPHTTSPTSDEQIAIIRAEVAEEKKEDSG